MFTKVDLQMHEKICGTDNKMWLLFLFLQVKDAVEDSFTGKIISVGSMSSDNTTSYLYNIAIETDTTICDLFVQKTLMDFFLKEQESDMEKIIQDDKVYRFFAHNSVIMDIKELQETEEASVAE